MKTDPCRGEQQQGEGDPTVDSIRRTPGLLRRLRAYSHVFSWRQIALFMLGDFLVAWLASPGLGRSRVLRKLTYEIPVEFLRVEGGLCRFPYRVWGRDVVLSLRQRSSDIEVFLQIFRSREYEDVTRVIASSCESPAVIDAGANIGMSTLYLKCALPTARILALEPEPGNFTMLSSCIRENRLQDVTPMNVALWTDDTRLSPDRSFRDGEAWSFAVKESAPVDEAPIPATSLASLLAHVGWREVDLLKLDVEGTEAHLLRDPGFLRIVAASVKLLCVEVHEEVISRAEVQQTLESVGMASVRCGETLVAWRLNPDAGSERP